MISRQAHFPLIALLAVGSSAAAGDWPQFRGPTGQGLSDARNLPLRWSDSANVAWKRAIPGKGWSQPVVQGGRVYLTTAVPMARERQGGDSGEQSLRALCLDAASGEMVWNVEVFRQSAARIHSKNSHASSSPVTDGERLYVHFGTHGTACLDLTARVVWRNRSLVYEPVHGNGGSPVLAGPFLVVNCDGSDSQFVAALDRATGEIGWKKSRPPIDGKGFSFSTPLVIEVDGKAQIVSPGSDWVVSHDPRDGREIWRVRYELGYSVVPRPVFGHGLVFVCTGYDQPSLLAIRPDGRGDVTRTHVAWKATSGVPRNATPLLVEGELYFVSDSGVASCLDARTGARHWRQRIGGNHSASPVHGDGKIYFQSEEGEGIVIKPGREYVELSRNRLGERTLASYAIAGGAIFIRTAAYLYRIGAGD